MSTYIKSIDSKHLVTVGDEGFFTRPDCGSDYEYNGGTGVDWDRLIELPNIDFETMHLYPQGWGKTITWSLQYINDHIDTAKSVGKPVILEEYGVTSDKSSVYSQFGDAVYFSYEIGTGAAGNMFWLLTGVNDDGTLYANYDGFRVTYPSNIATVLTTYADMMSTKSSNGSIVNNSEITPTTATFDLNSANQEDISVTVTLNGNTLNGIYNGSTALTKDTDYTVDSGGNVTILKSYLATLDVGTVNLKFDFSAGTDQVLAVTIDDTTVYENSEISPKTATFDLYAVNQADIPVTITLNGNTLKGVYKDSIALTEDTDYTVADDGTVTILKSYFAKQSVGTVNLTFDFNHGTDPVLTVTVVNTAPVVVGDLEVQMFNSTTSASTNGINPHFKLINNGTEAVNLSTLTLRYYFTEDGTQPQNFWCDWSSAGTSNVTGKFVTLENAVTGADAYLEIGFTSDAGSLAVGESAEIQARFSKNDWTNYDQSDDYSFNSSGTSYEDWTKAPAYQNGTIIWGIEP